MQVVQNWEALVIANCFFNKKPASLHPDGGEPKGVLYTKPEEKNFRAGVIISFGEPIAMWVGNWIQMVDPRYVLETEPRMHVDWVEAQLSFLAKRDGVHFELTPFLGHPTPEKLEHTRLCLKDRIKGKMAKSLRMSQELLTLSTEICEAELLLTEVEEKISRGR